MRFEGRQYVYDPALGVGLVQGEQKGEDLVGRVGPQPNQGHEETGAPVVGGLGPGPRRAAVGLSLAGRRLLAVGGIGGGEASVECLEAVGGAGR